GLRLPVVALVHEIAVDGARAVVTGAGFLLAVRVEPGRERGEPRQRADVGHLDRQRALPAVAVAPARAAALHPGRLTALAGRFRAPEGVDARRQQLLQRMEVD